MRMPGKTRSTVSAVAVAFTALLLAAQGGAPTWWSERGLINPQGVDDDYQAANAGQLKNIATAACAEMEQELAQFGGAGADVTAMAQSLVAGDDYAAVNQGQLKYVVKPFYDRLIEIGYCSGYPWGTDEQDDWALMNIGQLKNVFSFDLAGDTDSDTMPDWWETKYGLDPNTDDRAADLDQDGLSNLEEFLLGTDPASSDTDGDGVPDGWEVAHGHDPNSKDPVIELGEPEASIEVKQLAASCLYILTPCWTEISDIQEYWDLVDAADWPAWGLYHVMCGDGNPPYWELHENDSGNPVAYRHQVVWPAQALYLSRILYRYYPSAPTEEGMVYRITVLEVFEPDGGGTKSVEAVRRFYLSGDGTNENYFEPEGGFGDEGGQMIDAPSQLGTVRPFIIRADLDVDTDRDGDVDDHDEVGEDSWSKGPGSRGALVLPNCDDDGSDGWPDNWIGGDWDVDDSNGPEPASTVIDADPDKDDLAPMHAHKLGMDPLPDDLTITLKVSVPAEGLAYNQGRRPEERLRVFLPGNQVGNNLEVQAADSAIIGPEMGDVATFVSGDSDHPISIFAGNGMIKFGVEGIEFGSHVDIEIFATLGEEVLSSDKVRLRVAPFVLADHSVPIDVTPTVDKTVFVSTQVDNGLLRDQLRSDYPSRLDEVPTQDIWHQDGYEIGYARASYGDMPVVLSLPRNYFLFGDSLRKYCHNVLLRPDIGVCVTVEAYASSSEDAGGNIESIPVPDRPGTFFHGYGMNSEITAFFSAQDVNAGLAVDTLWLDVRHVDEVVSVTPDGQRFFVANPDVCWALLAWAASSNPPDAKMLQGMNGIPGGVTAHSVVSNDDLRHWSFNIAANGLRDIRQALNLPSAVSEPVKVHAGGTGNGKLVRGGAFIGFFPNNNKRHFRIELTSSDEYTLKFKEDGAAYYTVGGTGSTTEDCVFSEARCFILMDYWFPPPDEGDVFEFHADPECEALDIPVLYTGGDAGAVAYSHNYVNCLVDGDRAYTAKSYGPKVDYFGDGASDILEDYVLALFGSVYSSLARENCDERGYHNWGGSIHCGTNVRRELPEYDWWEY